MTSVIIQSFANEALNYTLTIDYSKAIEKEAKHSSGQIFSLYEVDGLINYADLNNPTLPRKALTFEVPIYVNNFTISVQSYELNKTVSLNNSIVPYEAQTTNEVFDNASNQVIYGTGYISMPNGPIARIADEYFVDAMRHFVVVEISPVAYNHLEARLSCYSNINILLEYSKCTAQDMPFRLLNQDAVRPIHQIDDSFIIARSSSIIEKSTSLDKGIYNYLILTPQTLTDGLYQFAEWKRQKGYSVTIQTFEDIYTNPEFKIGATEECFDDASCTREWMRNFYNQNGPFYCLIVGDFRTSAPIRKFYSRMGGKVLNDKNSKCYIPSDNYFADLVSDWNLELNETGIYCVDVVETKFSPTIPIGRLLCNSIEEIQYFTEKVIIYELNPGKGDADYLLRGLSVKHQDFSSLEDVFEHLSDFEVTTIKSNSANSLLNLKPTPLEIINEMNSSGFISFNVHGAPYCLTIASVEKESNEREHTYLITESKFLYGYWYGNYNTGALDALSNNAKPAILYSTACTVSPFDNQFGDSEFEHTIGQTFTSLGRYGGPAMLSNTRDGYMVSSEKLEVKFGELMNNHNSEIGILENCSKISFLTKPAYTGSHVKFAHNIIGDCSLRIWKNVPELLNTSIMYSGYALQLINHGFYDGFWGIRSGDFTTRGNFSYKDNIVTIPFNSLPIQSSALVTIFMESEQFLPHTFLFTSGQAITNHSERIVVNGIKFSNTNPLLSNKRKQWILSKDHSCPLHIGLNSEISIYSYDDITSNKGISVGSGAKLTLESEKDVTLDGDVVKNGSVMNVSAHSVTISGGFIVERGANFTVNTKSTDL